MANSTLPTASTSPRPSLHGIARGLEATAESQLFTGRFGRMFRSLPAARFFDEDLDALAAEMTADPELDNAGRPTATPENQRDDEEDTSLAAGFTYLGQFIDHDLTFDPMSSLMKQNDPDQLTDFRTPRFDLDNVYGRGPADQPYLYEDDERHFRLGRRLTGAEEFDAFSCDLPRHKSSKGSRARALIGDPRNDENVIVAQLHVNMLRFHNRLIDFYGTNASFEEVQRQVRWHYQWVVLHDFLPKIVGQEMIYDILPHLKNKQSIQDAKPHLRFYKWHNEPFMPVEFSVAAYRFGHSIVRPLYRLNTTLVGGGPNNDPINGRIFIFTPDDFREGLNGFREFPSEWAIDWRLFFGKVEATPPSDEKKALRRVQPTYKMDSSLVNPLGMLPISVASQIRALAARNLRRGTRLGLPSGQDVARAMGIKPIPDEKLRVGKAIDEDMQDKQKNLPITAFGDSFKGRAPLWFYILAEAQQAFKNDLTPLKLGPVGGRIVAEVFIGILLGDQHSFLSQSPNWHPESSFCAKDGSFGMLELIQQAIKAS